MVPDAGQPGTDRNAGPRRAVFSTNHAKNAVVEGVFPYGFNRFTDRVPIQQLLFVHHLCVVMADFDHFRQCAGTGQSDDLGVVGILFHRYLFHRDGWVFLLEFLNQFRNDGLTFLLHRRMHKFNGDVRWLVVLTS